MRRLVPVLLLAAGSALLAPAPAGAATLPDCNDIAYRTNNDPRVDRAVWFPSSLGRVSCNLGTWSRDGSAVRDLQIALNACYRAGLTLDGSYGPLTRAAVMIAQRSAGVRVDGVYGPITRSAMKWPTERASGASAGCDYGRNYI